MCRASLTHRRVCLEACVCVLHPAHRTEGKVEPDVSFGGRRRGYTSTGLGCSSVGGKVGMVTKTCFQPPPPPSCQRLSKTTFPNFWLPELHSRGVHHRILPLPDSLLLIPASPGSEGSSLTLTAASAALCWDLVAGAAAASLCCSGLSTSAPPLLHFLILTQTNRI